MNTLGKLLVIAILIMSLVFMAFAVTVYSTHKNWRDLVVNDKPGPGKPLGLQRQLADMRTKNGELQGQLDTLTKEITDERAAHVKSLAELQNTLTTLKQEYDKQVAEHAALVEGERQAVAATEAAHKTLEALRGEVTKLRTDIRTVQQEKEDEFNRAVKLADELNQNKAASDLLKKRNVQLTDQLAQARAVLESHDLDENQPIDGIPPKVDGVVLAVGNDGMIEVSLGADDGLRKGNTLEVFRHAGTVSKYLGRIQVVRTSPDKAVGKIMPEFRKGNIQKEDRVATRLN
ncbi:MAG: hypothetical protein JNG90_09390 [Planctomycetaceae bacterium]|nr:hypothetical protein [Planctomycetaceae bacterium]